MVSSPKVNASRTRPTDAQRSGSPARTAPRELSDPASLTPGRGHVNDRWPIFARCEQMGVDRSGLSGGRWIGIRCKPVHDLRRDAIPQTSSTVRHISSTRSNPMMMSTAERGSVAIPRSAREAFAARTTITIVASPAEGIPATLTQARRETPAVAAAETPKTSHIAEFALPARDGTAARLTLLVWSEARLVTWVMGAEAIAEATGCRAEARDRHRRPHPRDDSGSGDAGSAVRRGGHRGCAALRSRRRCTMG